MKITTVGIDLAKNAFQIHGVDERGHAILKKQLKRSRMMAFFVNLPPCLIGNDGNKSLLTGRQLWRQKLAENPHGIKT